MNKNIIVKESPIQGKGVFAGRDYRKGEIVLIWDLTNQITEEQYKRLPEDEKQYVAAYQGRYIVQQAPAKFVNHSCDANTYVKNFCDIAKRDIKEGEEITSDYREDSGSDLDMECHCGNPKCTGRITNTNQAFNRNDHSFQ